MQTSDTNQVNHVPKRSRAWRLGAAVPRLITLTAGHQTWTLRPARRELAARGVRHDRWRYDRLFNSRTLPRATYIFTDFDRLLPWHIELAAKIYIRLKDAGLTVLNDPRHYVPRWAILRRLHAAGINDFTCWLPMLNEWPERYPAFLRTVHAHRSVESDLLRGEAEASSALNAALDRGLALNDLVFIEFAAESTDGKKKFRKHAAYRVGDRVVRALTVTDQDWVAKIGTLGAASDLEYANDLAEHRDYPRADFVRNCFDTVGMNYGRIDYGFVAGRPQVYELNTNPMIAWSKKHPNKDRVAANLLVRDQLNDAYAALCQPNPGPRRKIASEVPRRLFHGAKYRQP